jgi:hypothetical protein
MKQESNCSYDAIGKREITSDDISETHFEIQQEVLAYVTQDSVLLTSPVLLSSLTCYRMTRRDNR